MYPNQKSSVQSPDYKLSIPINQGISKFRNGQPISPKYFQVSKGSNLNFGEGKISINDSQFPTFLKSK